MPVGSETGYGEKRGVLPSLVGNSHGEACILTGGEE